MELENTTLTTVTKDYILFESKRPEIGKSIDTASISSYLGLEDLKKMGSEC